MIKRIFTGLLIGMFIMVGLAPTGCFVKKAHATGIPVIDGLNLVENAISAMTELEQMIGQITQIANELTMIANLYQMIINWRTHLARLAGEIIGEHAGELFASFEELQGLATAAYGAYSSFKDMEAEFNNFYAILTTPPLEFSMDDFKKQIYDQTIAGAQNQIRRLQTNAALETDQKRLQKIINSMSGQDGVVGNIQIGNQIQAMNQNQLWRLQLTLSSLVEMDAQARAAQAAIEKKSAEETERFFSDLSNYTAHPVITGPDGKTIKMR